MSEIGFLLGLVGVFSIDSDHFVGAVLIGVGALLICADRFADVMEKRKDDE